ncbi:flippase [Candidatus Woesearchaeota archaeon]|nr:flippase [Candidatus Woesearchaeota archaeon]
MKDYLKQGIRGSMFVLAASIGANVLGYFTRMFLARNLSLEDFGLFYSLLTFFMFIQLFADFGYGLTLAKYVPDFLARKKKRLSDSSFFHVFMIKMVLSLCFAAVLYLFSDWLALEYFGIRIVKRMIVLFIMILFANNILEFIFQVYISLQDMFKYSINYLASKALFLIFIIAFFDAGFNADALLPTYAYLMSLCLVLAGTVIPMYVSINPSRILFSFDRILFRRLTRFAFPTMLSSMGGMIIGYIDVIILTFFVTLDQVGIYNTVLPTILMIGYLNGAIVTVFLPMVSEMWAKKDVAKIRKGLSLIYKYSILFTVPCSILSFFYADVILDLLFGPEYIAGALAMKILSFGVCLLGLSLVNFSVLSGIGRPEKVTVINLTTAGINAVLNILLIPFYGIEGAALTTTLSYLIMFLWSYNSVKNYLNFKIYPNFVLKLFGISIIFAILILFCRSFGQNKVYTIIGLFVSCIIFIISLIITKTVKLQEITFFLSSFLSGFWKYFAFLLK